MSASSNNQPRTRTGCQNCRLRHLKCDEQRPACTRCEKAGIECVRGYNIRFRHGANPSVANVKGSGLARTEYDFSKSQPWVNTARNLTFLDETQELVSIYDHAAEPETSYAPPLQWTEGTHSTPSPAVDEAMQVNESPAIGSMPLLDRINSAGQSVYSDLSSPTKRRKMTFNSTFPVSPFATSPPDHHQSPSNSWHESPHAARSPTSITGNLGHTPSIDSTFAGLEHTSSLGQQSFTAVSESLSRIYLDTPVWPLANIEEARLLRYYVEHIARNFDLTDPLKHFRNIVPQRAATCPTLLNAILALSARHLSRIDQYDPLISNKYHQECLKHLIPMLDDNAALLDENLLASTIILRHLEEIEVPLSGQLPSEQQSHLLGAHAFITAQERATIAGGLRQAAFWVGLRQEIYVAFVNQRSIIPALEHCNIDRSLEAASDHIWACRMVVLCADVIRYCFGDDDHSHGTHAFLTDAVAQWFACKPASFTPVFFRAAGYKPSATNPDSSISNIFPEMWFVGDEVVTALQYYHLSRILLSAHNPRMPRLGPGRAAAIRAMDDEIKEHVRVLCGMCLSNPSTPPNFTYASMGVTMAGDKFTERAEQEALLGVLDMCEQQHAWPTGAAKGNLKVAWGWEEGE